MIISPVKVALIAVCIATGYLIVSWQSATPTYASHSLSEAKAAAAPVCHSLAKEKSVGAYQCNNPDSKIISSLSGYLSRFGCRAYVVGGSSVWVKRL